MSVNVDAVAWGVVLAASLAAGLIDLWKLRVPNWLTLPLMAGGLVFHTTCSGVGGLGFSLGGLLLGGGLLFFLFAMGGMGAGDVKMLAALGAWIGPREVFVLFLVASIAAGAVSLLISVGTRRLRQVLTNVSLTMTHGWLLLHHLGEEQRIEETVTRQDRRSRVIPFATMMFVGAVVAVLLAR